MKKPIKFVLLQTEDETLFVVKNNKKQTLLVIPRDKKHRSNLLMGLNYVNKHLYATVSQDIEPIKIGDYVIQTNFEKTHSSLILIENEMQCKFANDTSGSFTKRKVIATTDPKLTKSSNWVEADIMGHWECENCGEWTELIEDRKCNCNPIAQLQQSFLKEFVANPKGEWEVEYVYDVDILEEYNKEVDYTGSSCIDLKDGLELKLNQDNTVNITSVE
tara:strand:+ start:65 stop:718 length:654 start_codon:yes stop_codon:yes gene_type:complete